MKISMYQASVPVFVRMLTNLEKILATAAAHAEASGIEPKVLIDARLFPDMFPLSRQVQIASDQAKGGAARLAGLEPPSYKDDEDTFDALIERVRKTRDFVQKISASQIDGSEEKDIVLQIGDMRLEFKGMAYLLGFVLPNFYFHIATAYDILRHNGVELGKRDFLGDID